MRCLRLLQLLLPVLVLAGCSKTPPAPAPTLLDLPTDLGQKKSLTWKDYADRGLAHLEKMEWDQAVDELTKAIQLQPDNAELRIWRSDGYRNRKQLDLALADCERAIALDADYQPAYLNRGYVLADKREYDQALADLTKVIDSKKAVPFDAFYTRGQCYKIKGDYQKAIGDFSAALALKATDVNTLTLRGDVHFLRKDYTAAIADYTKTLELQPDHFFVLLKRSEALVGNKQYPQALADADEAIKLREKNADAHNARGWAHIGLHRYADALDDFTRAIELEPKNPLHYGDRGRCLANLLHDYDKARLDHDKAIALGPKEGLFYYDRGKTFFARKDLKAALADFTKATELDRGFYLAWLGRGSVLVQLKSEEAAQSLLETIKLCNEVLDDRPNDDVAYWARGSALMVQGFYKPALGDFEHALTLDPAAHHVCKELAWIQATCPQDRFRDGKKAISNATRACELSQWKDAEYLDALAAAYAEAGQLDEAVRRAKEALTLAWPEFRPEVAARLELYRGKKPYRSP